MALMPLAAAEVSPGFRGLYFTRSFPSTLAHNEEIKLAMRIAIDDRGGTVAQAERIILYCPFINQPTEHLLTTPWLRSLTDTHGCTVMTFGIRSEPSRDPKSYYPYREAGWFPDAIAAIDAARKRFGLKSRKIHLLGDSAGGSMAQQLAGQFPERIASIAIVGGGRYDSRSPGSAPGLFINTRGDYRAYATSELLRSWTPAHSPMMMVTEPRWGMRGDKSNYNHSANDLSLSLLVQFTFDAASPAITSTPPPLSQPLDLGRPWHAVILENSCSALAEKALRLRTSADYAALERAFPEIKQRPVTKAFAEIWKRTRYVMDASIPLGTETCLALCTGAPLLDESSWVIFVASHDHMTRARIREDMSQLSGMGCWALWPDIKTRQADAAHRLGRVREFLATKLKANVSFLIDQDSLGNTEAARIAQELHAANPNTRLAIIGDSHVVAPERVTVIRRIVQQDRPVDWDSYPIHSRRPPLAASEETKLNPFEKNANGPWLTRQCRLVENLEAQLKASQRRRTFAANDPALAWNEEHLQDKLDATKRWPEETLQFISSQKAALRKSREWLPRQDPISGTVLAAGIDQGKAAEAALDAAAATLLQVLKP